MRLNEKKTVVDELKECFNNAGVMIMADYSGLSSNDLNALRKECHDSEVSFQVVKNTLARRALKDSPYEFLSGKFRGPIAIAHSQVDQVAPAKVLAKAKDKYKALDLLFGGLDGQELDASAIEALSKMASRDELRAQLLGLFSNVPGGFVRLLNAVPGGLVNVLNARKIELEENQAA